MFVCVCSSPLSVLLCEFGMMYKLLQLLILSFACPAVYALIQCRCNETEAEPRDCNFLLSPFTCQAHDTCYAQVYLNDEGVQHYRYGCIDTPFNNSNLTECAVQGPTSHIVCCSNGPLCNANVTLPDIRPTVMTSLTPPTTEPVVINPTESHLAVVIALPIASVVFLIIIIAAIVAGTIFSLRRKKLHRRNSIPMNNIYPSDPCEGNGMMPYEPTMDISEFGITSGSGAGKTRLVQSTISRQIKLGDVIGKGRYGKVYVGQYQGDKIAVKIFFSKDERSWFREIEIYTSVLLRHDNILGFIAGDIVSTDGVTQLWLITQYYHHGSLYDYLNREELSAKSFLSMAIALCSGLTHLHTEIFGTQAKPAIAHRDMKSKNVLVKNGHSVCIADFGLAVLNNSHMNGINMPTNPKQGTKRYMAPEILDESILHTKFDSFKKVDIYATGLVLWEMAKRCNRPPSHPPGEYEVPFQGLVPPDPSFEEMKLCVVVERRQPTIPAWWSQDDLLHELSMMMVECWHPNNLTRPSAIYLKKKLKRIAEEFKLDSDSE